jgi:hypothetical protein
MAPPMRQAQGTVKHPTSMDLYRLREKARRGIKQQNGDPESRQGYLRRVHVKFYALLKAEGFYVEGAP